MVSRAPHRSKGPDLETLTEVIMLVGTCDQLKMPSLMSFERVCRRLQLIVEAHAEVGQAPSWKMARYLNGVSTVTDVVSPALRQYGTRRVKEEAEVGFTRVRQMQGVASNVEADVTKLVDVAKEGAVVAAGA